MTKVNIAGVDLTPQQAEIYGLINRFSSGVTDHALVAVATHEMKKPYSESSIRSRRCELTRKGLVKPIGSVVTRSGRKATRWTAA